MKKFYANALTFRREPGRDGIGDIHQPVYLAYEVDAELDALRAQLAEARAVFRDLEWSHQEGFNDPPGIVRCPICGNTKTEGHDPDCRLSKLINTPEVPR